MTRDDIKRAIANTSATTIQCGLEANERVTVTVLGQDVYLAMCAELRRLWAQEKLLDAVADAARADDRCMFGCCCPTCVALAVLDSGPKDGDVKDKP